MEQVVQVHIEAVEIGDVVRVFTALGEVDRVVRARYGDTLVWEPEAGRPDVAEVPVLYRHRVNVVVTYDEPCGECAGHGGDGFVPGNCPECGGRGVAPRLQAHRGDDGWYVCDVSSGRVVPVEGPMTQVAAIRAAEGVAA